MNDTTTMTNTDTLTSTDVDLLVAYMADEEASQRDLLEKLERKEECLVRQDLDALQQCLAETEPIVARLEACTRRRVRILRAIGGRLGVDPEEIRVATLVSRAPAGDRRRLEEAREKLRDVLARIGRQNRRNHVLIKNGIEVNDALVRALFGGGEEAPRTYDRSARGRPLPQTRSYLNQEL